MNIRYIFSVVLLFSTFSKLFSEEYFWENDFEYCESENESRALENICVNACDIQAGLVYIISKDIPDAWNCSFDLKGRVKKEVLKYFVNRYLIKDSLNITPDVPSFGTLPILTNEQALEIGYYIANDLIHKVPKYNVLTHGCKLYVREKIVALVLWILNQSNLELLLPAALTNSELYDITRTEVARYSIDHLLECIK